MTRVEARALIRPPGQGTPERREGSRESYREADWKSQAVCAEFAWSLRGRVLERSFSEQKQEINPWFTWYKGDLREYRWSLVDSVTGWRRELRVMKRNIRRRSVSEMRFLRYLLAAVAMVALAPAAMLAKNASDEICPRPAAGSAVPEPADLRSQNGTLKVELRYRSVRDAHGQMRYCYQAADGSIAPNLRVHPGDWLILSLKNDLKATPSQSPDKGKTMSMPMPMQMPMPVTDPCADGEMTALSTNLHFHGLAVPPVCHQDDVLRTMIGPGDPAFEYRFQIPPDTPPGLYWYHPHVHGFSNAQVLGGASGALIVEGIESANSLLGGLPERVFVVRDQDLINPDAAPLKAPAVPQAPVLHDAEGDILNTGTGEGKPSKDLSINFVPVAFPDYPPAVIAMKPDERQLWRVVNASAITYLDLQILVGGAPQAMGLVSLDGVPVNEGGMIANRMIGESHVLMPPAGRIDFVFKAPPEGTQASLITRAVDTGAAGENDPTRPLATILAKADALEPRSALPASAAPATPITSVWLGNVKPAHERKLYFSEKPSDPNNPNSPTVFMITVDGQEPVPYDPKSSVPNITVRQGDVEDWVIENRSKELHAFHIHQIHFLLVGWNGVPVDEPFLRDTVNVPYWNGASPVYPSVKLRMDFRDPSVVGTFVYHCHLLEHEDGGMMGTIRVEPALLSGIPADTPSSSSLASWHFAWPPRKRQVVLFASTRSEVSRNVHMRFIEFHSSVIRRSWKWSIPLVPQIESGRSGSPRAARPRPVLPIRGVTNSTRRDYDLEVSAHCDKRVDGHGFDRDSTDERVGTP